MQAEAGALSAHFTAEPLNEAWATSQSTEHRAWGGGGRLQGQPGWSGTAKEEEEEEEVEEGVEEEGEGVRGVIEFCCAPCCQGERSFCVYLYL